MKRYEIRPLKEVSLVWGVWDRKIGVWQTKLPTRKAAREWVVAKEAVDRSLAPSTLQIRMPARD